MLTYSYLNIIFNLTGINLLARYDRQGLIEEAVNIARIPGQDFADAYVHVNSKKAGADSIAIFNRTHFKRMGSVLTEL